MNIKNTGRIIRHKWEREAVHLNTDRAVSSSWVCHACGMWCEVEGRSNPGGACPARQS